MTEIEKLILLNQCMMMTALAQIADNMKLAFIWEALDNGAAATKKYIDDNFELDRG